MKNSNNEVDETVESSSPVPKSKSLQNKGLVENASELQLNPETGSDSSDPLAKAKQQILNSIEANFTQSTIPPSEGDEEKIHMKPTETFNDRTWLPDSIKHPKVDRTDARSIDQAGYPDNEDSSLYATLDMIITIVGEFYGQKDLLTGRMLWDEM